MAVSSLRDMSQETEQDQRKRITEMEKDITGIDDLQCTWVLPAVGIVSSLVNPCSPI